MQPVAIETSRATVESAAEISQLLEANGIARGGQLYGDWSEQVVATWLDDGMQAFVARIDNAIKGVILTSEAYYLKSPPVMRMLETTAIQGDFYIYGPVCIAADMRGAGVLAKLWEAAKSFYGTRRAVLFVDRNNHASLAAHARLGMVRLGEFEVAGRHYYGLASEAASETEDPCIR